MSPIISAEITLVEHNDLPENPMPPANRYHLSWILRNSAALMLALVPISYPTGHVWGQSRTKDRQDERRENERVEKNRRELTQSQSEVKKLQLELQQKSNAFVAARGAYLRAKKRADEALEHAEERVGATLGIPEQMQVVRQASLDFQSMTKSALETLRQSEAYVAISKRHEEAEEALGTGILPNTDTLITSSEHENLEQSIARDKQAMKAMEDAAISEDPDASKAAKILADAQAKMHELKGKLSPSRIQTDFAYKQAKAEQDKAFKKMQTASDAFKKTETALQRKANELGMDYKSYLRAKQSDAIDKNQGPQKGKQNRGKK